MSISADLIQFRLDIVCSLQTVSASSSQRVPKLSIFDLPLWEGEAYLATCFRNRWRCIVLVTESVIVSLQSYTFHKYPHGCKYSNILQIAAYASTIRFRKYWTKRLANRLQGDITLFEIFSSLTCPERRCYFGRR